MFIFTKVELLSFSIFIFSRISGSVQSSSNLINKNENSLLLISISQNTFILPNLNFNLSPRGQPG
ncbi:hypothetical protein BH10BAC5_BH10BAC5_01320 [soil metagenome]